MSLVSGACVCLLLGHAVTQSEHAMLCVCVCVCECACVHG